MSEQREMTLDEWVNRLSEFHLVNKQYQQLKQRIEKLERKLQLEEELNHVAEGGFTQLATTVGEQRHQIAELEQRNNELAATVEQLRDALRHLYHNAKASGCEMGLALDVAEEALESTPQQNLNTVKREVAIEAFLKGAEWWAQCELDDTLYLNEHQASIDYANTKYPNDKDNE